MIIDVYKNILTISIKETYIDQFYNFQPKVNEKYSIVVPFDFNDYNDYNDLSQYIVDSSKRLIDMSLERTYTLKGKKIKLGK